MFYLVRNLSFLGQQMNLRTNSNVKKYIAPMSTISRALWTVGYSPSFSKSGDVPKTNVMVDIRTINNEVKLNT